MFYVFHSLFNFLSIWNTVTIAVYKPFTLTLTFTSVRLPWLVKVSHGHIFLHLCMPGILGARQRALCLVKSCLCCISIHILEFWHAVKLPGKFYPLGLALRLVRLYQSSIHPHDWGKVLPSTPPRAANAVRAPAQAGGDSLGTPSFHPDGCSDPASRHFLTSYSLDPQGCPTHLWNSH